MAYVTRDGATRATRPFALAALVWSAIDIVDAFLRTLLIEGYADAYAGRASASASARGTARAPGAPRGRVAVNRASASGGASVRGFANVRTIDHTAPTVGG
jgi:hypothetical protein